MIPKQLQDKNFKFLLVQPGTKKPFERNWQVPGGSNYSYDDPKLVSHLEHGGNWGLLGGVGDVLTIDCDQPEVARTIGAKLPKTFSIKTGRGKKNFIFICRDCPGSVKEVNDRKGEVFSLRHKGEQALLPGSVHPDTKKKYEVWDDVPIAEVSWKDLQDALSPFMSSEMETLAEEERKFTGRERLDTIPITSVVSTSGLTRRGDEYQGENPIHGCTSHRDEPGHKCSNFSLNPSKNAWYCHVHGTGGSSLSLIAVKEGIISCRDAVPGALRGKIFKDVLKVAQERYGLRIEKEKGVQAEKPSGNIVNGNEVVYSNIPTFNKVELDFKGVVYEGLEKNNDKGFKVVKNYKLYKALYGQGHAPIYVVTPPETFFPRGVQEVCIEQIDFAGFEEKYSSQAHQQTGIVLEGKEGKEPKTLGDILSQNRVYELKNIIPGDIVKGLLELNNSEILENILRDFFHMNGEIDSRIYYAYRGLLINVPRVIPKFQKYNSHTIHIDGGKTGKTTLSFKLCGKTYGSASGSRMLGYASGDKSFSGSLDGEFRGVAFDDINTTNYPEDFLNAFPNLMEQGEARIGKGSQEILTRSSSPFLLTTNTSSLGAVGSLDLLLQFEEIIKKLGNAVRIGSRFGLILFGNDFKEVTEKEAKLSDKDLEINEILVNQIFQKYASRLLVTCFEEAEIQKFLNTPRTELGELFKNNDKNQMTRTFWIQFAKGFRHINGTALKQALLDYVIEKPRVCLTEEIDFNRLLMLCEENLKQVIGLNLKAFQNICIIEENQQELAKKRFESLPGYQQALLVGLYNYLEEKHEEGRTGEKFVPIELLQDFLDPCYGKYTNISGLLQVLEKVRILKVNVSLEDYGVKLIERSGLCLEVLSLQTMVNLVKMVTTPRKTGGEGL